MGNFLGPASTDKPLHVTTRTFRQTRTFATRHIEVSQEQDNEKPRVCLFATADFQIKEKENIFEYSRTPSKSYSHHTSLPSTMQAAQNLLDCGKVEPGLYNTFVEAFSGSASIFDIHPCPEGIFAQNLSGVARCLPHSQDSIPLASRTTADWFRSSSPLSDTRDQLAALAFYCDGALSFCPLAFSHESLDKTASWSSLDFAMRIFRDVDLNHWHLREVQTHVGGEGRTFSESWVWDEAGRAVANMSQQSIMRALPGKGKASL